MGLEKYQKKRKFEKTPEPKGEVSKTGKNRFVVQEHHARNIHYDFRLEMERVLKSWAITKTPPKTAGTKRLAMQTEDHPVEYISFEGTIPKGQYGAGKVKIWDKGKYILEKKEKNELLFELQGKKLKGKYALIRPSGSRFGKKAWLFFKMKSP